jgi:hypothetical protein
MIGSQAARDGVFLQLPGAAELVQIVDGEMPAMTRIPLGDGGTVTAVTSDGISVFVASPIGDYGTVRIMRIDRPSR